MISFLALTVIQLSIGFLAGSFFTYYTLHKAKVDAALYELRSSLQLLHSKVDAVIKPIKR